MALAACLDPKVSLLLDSPPALVCASLVWVRAQLVHGFNRCVHFPSERPPVELKVTRALGRVSEPDKQLKLIRSPPPPPPPAAKPAWLHVLTRKYVFAWVAAVNSPLCWS